MVKIDERGRGKFKPAPDYTQEQVRETLLQKLKKSDRIRLIHIVILLIMN